MSGDQEEFVDAISRNSDRLIALANDLLTVSSLESGRPNHSHVTVNLATIVASAQAALEE